MSSYLHIKEEQQAMLEAGKAKPSTRTPSQAPGSHQPKPRRLPWPGRVAIGIDQAKPGHAPVFLGLGFLSCHYLIKKNQCVIFCFWGLCRLLKPQIFAIFFILLQFLASIPCNIMFQFIVFINKNSKKTANRACNASKKCKRTAGEGECA